MILDKKYDRRKITDIIRKSRLRKAYHTLYDMWISRLYRFVYQYLKSEDATDDVVQ